MSLLSDPTRLSTSPEGAPAPPPAARRGRTAPLRRGWRQLTSMRTALLLLFLLALAAVPGSVVPQRGLNPIKVADFVAAHPRLAPVLDRLGLFDVFAAPWFAAIYLLLFVSLAGCLVPRIGLHARAVRRPPPAAPRHLDRLPHSAAVPTSVEAARRVLRRGRWRLADGPDGSLAAEKGYLRETGNLLFHVSLLVLLGAIAWGSLFGYKGTVLVVEGDAFSDTVSQYDDFTPGRLFREAALPPFTLGLEDFTATYAGTGAPTSFTARLQVADRPGAPGRRYDLRVNHPLRVPGARTYLIGHGYAPVVSVRDGTGAVVLDGPVPFLPQDATFLSNGVVKVPDARPDQLAFAGFFTPTTAASPRGFVSVSPAADRPGLTLLAYRGDLGLDSGVAQNVYQLDTRRLTPVGTTFLEPGATWELPGGGSITFAGHREWVTLQVAADPGKGLALLAATGMLVGLLLSLRVRRRRLWVRATTGGPGRNVVLVGGLARTDGDRFAEEFAELTRRMSPATTSLRQE